MSEHDIGHASIRRKMAKRWSLLSEKLLLRHDDLAYFVNGSVRPNVSKTYSHHRVKVMTTRRR
jgi:hypothetical protein